MADENNPEITKVVDDLFTVHKVPLKFVHSNGKSLNGWMDGIENIPCLNSDE